MWLSRRLTQLKGARIVSLPHRPDLGVQRLLNAFKAEAKPLMVMEFDEADACDAQAQALKFSDAATSALGVTLVAPGLPVAAGLRILAAFEEIHGRPTYLLFGAEHAPQLIDLLRGSDAERLILVSKVPLEVPKAIHLDEDSLKLTEEEACALAGGMLSREEVVALLQEADYAYETFNLTLHDRVGLPSPLVPTLWGPQLPPGTEIAVPPDELLEVLVEREEWSRALALVVRHLPERASTVLSEAGPHFINQGLHGRLWHYLDLLPADYEDDTVLFWKLSAGIRLNRHEELGERIQAHLQRHEAPELRALHAGIFLTHEEAHAEVQRAALLETPFTLHMQGFFERDTARGIDFLKRAVRLAERKGRTDDAVRSADTLAVRLMDAGHYREALHWSGWNLDLFEKRNMKDLTRKLLLINNYAFARILTGEISGLGSLLSESERAVAGIFDDYAELLRRTLGDYYAAISESAKALPLYRLTYENSPREELGLRGLPLVKALLDVSEDEEAAKVAERVYHLTEDLAPIYRQPAVLAQGMILCCTLPHKGIKLLTELLADAQLPAYLSAQARLYQAYALMELNNEAAARAQLTHPSLSDLAESGLRFLSGPEERFRDLWDVVLGEVALELRFLGHRDVWLEGKRLSLPLQSLELLTILAQYPMGLSSEKLALELYGEQGTTNALYVAIKKLRQWVPISNPPYRLEYEVRADFLEFGRLVRNGKLKEAMTLYRGSLLEEAQAPALERLREDLEAQVYEAMLVSNDADALSAYSEHVDDDLAIWERLLEVLPPGDPRTLSARVKAKTVAFEYS